MNTGVGKRLLFTTVCIFVLMLVVDSRSVTHYITVMKQESVRVDRPMDTNDDLRQQIERWKQDWEQAPINARLDRIWKAIPGYNGRVIDVEATLVRMKQSGKQSPEQLVYKQVPPAVTLEQLGVHPIYRGNPKKPVISFMINVAWGNEYLDSILTTLDEYDVKTTFFLDGSWVKRYPEEAKKIVQHGHEIGNHAYSHPEMRKLGAQRIRQEIGRTQEVIAGTVGITPYLFAPPSGSFSQSVVDIAHQEYKMKTILWTADTVDWRKPPVQEMVSRVTAKMENGVLVLMHPTAPSAEGLAQLIHNARQKGLTVTTVSEVLSSRRSDTP